MTQKNILTLEQEDLRAEFVETYGLDAEQINFEGESLNPILDYEAMCVLRVALTDFQDVSVSEGTLDKTLKFVTVSCTIMLADGRTVTVSEIAEKDETVNGEKLETFRQLRSVARSRAMRAAIRTAGVSILRAHREFNETGNKSSGKPVDPRAKIYAEVHVLAEKTGYITLNDKTEYQNLIAELYEGRTSAKDLNDIELRRLVTTLKSFERRMPNNSGNIAA